MMEAKGGQNPRRSNSRTRNHSDGQRTPSKGPSFKWFPKEYERWQNIELMKFIEKSPEHLGKLEQELKSHADVQIQGHHVIVSRNDKEIPKNWRQQCERKLEMFFKEFSVQILRINKELKPSSYGKGSNTEVTKQGLVGNDFLVSVTGLAKDVEKKMFNLREQDKTTHKNAAAGNASHSVPRKQQHQPQPLMQGNFQKHASSGPRYGPPSLMPRPQLQNISPSQVHPFHGYHPNAMQLGQNFHQPMPLPGHIIHPIQIEPQHRGRFTDEMLQEIRSSTYNVIVTWRGQFCLELSGPSRGVEKAREIINSRVSFQGTKTIFCKEWIFEALNHDIQEARDNYPELQIRFEGDRIFIVGHPTEVEPVHNRLNETVKGFLELNPHVPKECHGLIIGKKGQKIVSLQSKYKVSIFVPPSDTETSSIRIRGKISDSIRAEAEILNLVQQFEQSVKTVNFPSWLYSHLEAHVKQGKAKWKEVKTETGSVKITLTGPRSKVEPFHTLLEAKISELRKTLSCECIKVQEDHCKYIFANRMEKRNELAQRFQVDISQVQNDSIQIVGPKERVIAAKNEILRLISDLNSVTKTISVLSWMMKYVLGKGKVHVREIEQQFPQVKIEILRNKFRIIGSVEFVENACLHLQRKIDQVASSYKMVSIPMEANQMLGIRGHRYQNFKKIREEFTVNLRYTVNPVTLIVEGLVEKVEKAHVHIVKKVQNLVNFCILKTRVPPDQIGRLIGSGGSNINRLKSMYSGVTEIVTPRRDRPNDNVLLMGDITHVELLQDYLSNRYNAERVGDMDLEGCMHRNNRRSLHESYGNLSTTSQTLSEAGSVASMNDFDDEFVDSDNDEHGVDAFMAEIMERDIAVLHTWKDVEITSLNFVATSEVHLKKLKEKFQDFESVVVADNRKILVAGKSTKNAKQHWIYETESKLKTYFEEYASCKVSFHKRSSLDRSDHHEENLTIEWNEDKSTVFVCGLKERVDEICEEYEKIKARIKSVSVIVSSVNKYIIQYVKGSSAELRKFQSMFQDGSLTTATIELKAEIPEIQSRTEWRRKSEHQIKMFFAEYKCKEIPVPPVHAGEMRSHCNEHERLVICWSDKDRSLMIYGKKSDVDAKAKELEMKLERIKTEKVRVSYKRRVCDPYIFKFVKDWQSHTEKLIEKLGELGSPVLSDQNVIVYSEILKASSELEWEEKCEVTIRDFLDSYKFEEISMKSDECHIAEKLACTRQSVVTKWIAADSCLQVCGDKFAVDAMVKFIHERLQKEEEFNELNSGMNPSMDPVTKEVEVKKYGAYEFLNERIGMLDMSYGIKNHCEIRVERMPDETYGDKNFICIPPVEDDDKAQADFGNLTVTVNEGDITEADVDVIVNTTNKSFSFSGPLSLSVLSKSHIQISECHQCDTDMRISNGGNLKCKNIFHVAIPSQHESMSALVQKILEKAEEHQFSSIAIPTIGAGGGGWSCQKVSTGMRNGILNFVKANPNLKYLRTIKVILFGEMPREDKRPFYYNLLVEEGPSSRNENDSQQMQSVIHVLIYSVNNMFRSLSTPKAVKPDNTSITNDRGMTGMGAGKFAKIIITSKSKESAETAETEIVKFVNLHLREFSLDATSISRLKKPQVEKIMQIAKDKKIRTVIDRTKEVHKILIQGVSDKATIFHSDVQKIISEISEDFPETWDPMPEDLNMLRVELRPTSPEYFTVESIFDEANKDRYNHLNITKIERLQNKELYRHYAIKREAVSKKAQTEPFERQLFHGTTAETISLISEHGFDKCYAGKNATLYGNGTYFSKESSYSNAYASEASISDKTRQMFLANVLTGDFCQGYQGLPAAPPNHLTGRPYDSVVDVEANPTMFVVFKDSSTYPSYIISYTR